MTSQYSIVPLNETSALISFGNVIDIDINTKIIGLHRKLYEESFEGFIESVPAYSSLLVFYRRPAEFQTVKIHLTELIAKAQLSISKGSVVHVPVLYDGDDINFIAEFHQLSTNEVIEIHASTTYRVFMLGFLPGFAYMGIVDDRIATPRKETPRTAVPAGSVGIAGLQTGIYPQSSPGGWQLIGRTPVKIFDAQKKSLAVLKHGDEVKFYSISPSQFENLNEY